MRAKSSKQNSGSSENLSLSDHSQKLDSEKSKNNPVSDKDDKKQRIIDIEIPHDSLSDIAQASRFFPPIDAQDQREQTGQYAALQLKIIQLQLSDVAKKIWTQEKDQKFDLFLKNFHLSIIKYKESNIRKIFNILKFFHSYSSYVNLFKIIHEKNNDYINSTVWALLNKYDEVDSSEKYLQNLRSFCDEAFQILSNPYKHKTLTQFFRNIYFQLSEILFDIFRDENHKVDLTFATKIMNQFAISFKIHNKLKKIRTLNELFKAVHITQYEMSRFLKTPTAIPEKVALSLNFNFYRIQKIISDTKLIEIFLYLIELLQHLIDDTLDEIQDNEILECRCKRNENELIGISILNQLQFEICGSTPFLDLAKKFINSLDPQMPKASFYEYITNLFQQIDEFDSYDLKSPLFSIHYHASMLNTATSSLLTLLKTESYDQSESLRNIYIYLQKFMIKLKALENTPIQLWQMHVLAFSTFRTFKDVISLEINRNKFNCAYQGTSGFQRMFRYIRKLTEDFTVVDGTITFLMQLNSVRAKLLENCDLPTIRLDFNYYSPLQQIRDPNYLIAYNPIITEIMNDIDDTIFKISEDEILAPNLSNAFRSFIQYSYSDDVCDLLLRPELFENYDHLLFTIKEIFKNVIDDESSFYLDLRVALIEYVSVYYMLRILSFSGKFNFLTSLKLCYLRSHNLILFNHEYDEAIDLEKKFEIKNNPFYESIIDHLNSFDEDEKLNHEITYFRMYFNKFTEILFQLDPLVYKSHYKTIVSIFTWFTKPTKESDDNFLSQKYYFEVKRFKEFIEQAILNTVNQLKEEFNSSVENGLNILFEFQKLLTNLNNLQLHYIQHQQKGISKSYLREFLCGKTKQSQDQIDRQQFLWIYPVWINSIHQCTASKLIVCADHSFLKIFNSTEEQFLDDYKFFFNKVQIDYVKVFKELMFNANLAGNQFISMIVDILVRGSFSSETVSKLFEFFLQYLIELASKILNDKNQSVFSYEYNINLMKCCMKLSFLLISIYPYNYIRNNLKIDLLRNINMKNFVDSYILGFTFLLENMNHQPMKRQGLKTVLTDLQEIESISSTVRPNCPFDQLYTKFERISSKFEKISRYIAEADIQGYLKNIDVLRASLQDNDLDKIFQNACKSLILSATRNLSGTQLLSGNDESIAWDSIYSLSVNGYDTLFYENDDQNYIEKAIDDKNIRKSIKTSDYFNFQYLNVNMFANSLKPDFLELLSELKPEKTDGILQIIKSMNFLSLLFTLINDVHSFCEFSAFDKVSSVRLTPSFAIQFRPKQQFAQIDQLELDFDSKVNWTNQPSINSIYNRGCFYNSVENKLVKLQSNLIYFDTPQFTNIIESQIAFLPIYYVFDFNALNIGKFSLSKLLKNCDINLQQTIPQSTLVETIPDKQLPRQLQQALIEQIEINSESPDLQNLIEKEKLINPDQDLVEHKRKTFETLTRVNILKGKQDSQLLKKTNYELNQLETANELEKSSKYIRILSQLPAIAAARNYYSQLISSITDQQVQISQNLEVFKVQQNESRGFDISNQIFNKMIEKRKNEQKETSKRPFQLGSMFNPLNSPQNLKLFNQIKQQKSQKNENGITDNEDEYIDIQRNCISGICGHKEEEKQTEITEVDNTTSIPQIDETHESANSVPQNEQSDRDEYFDELSDLFGLKH